MSIRTPLSAGEKDIRCFSLGRSPALAPCLALSVTLLVAGCGNLTAGGGTGEASVVVSGDAPDPSPTPSVISTVESTPWSSTGAPDPFPTDHDDGTDGGNDGDDDDDDPEGELEAEFSLFLVSDDDTLVPLTDGDVEVRVDLQGLEEPEVAERIVAAGRYVALRIVFSEIEVEVDSGLFIDGEPVVGAIDIDIDTNLVVDKDLDLDIGEDERVVLVVDLNAASWLQAVDPVAKTVDPQDFADLIGVTLR